MITVNGPYARRSAVPHCYYQSVGDRTVISMPYLTDDMRPYFNYIEKDGELVIGGSEITVHLKGKELTDAIKRCNKRCSRYNGQLSWNNVLIRKENT